MKTFYKEDPFGKELFDKIYSVCIEADSGFNDLQYTKRFGRYDTLVEWDPDTEKKILELARKEFGEEDLEITYNQVTRYQIVGEYNPRLFMHVDTLPATHTIDVCLDTTVPEWGLKVLDKETQQETLFKDKKGSAVFLKGDIDEHGRDEYPSKDPSDYCKMLFINLAPSNHWAVIAKKTLPPEMIKSKYYPISVDGSLTQP